MIRLGIAAESRSDAHKIASLADRVVMERTDWIEESVIDDFRAWAGAEGAAFLDVHRAFETARARRLPLYGHFDGAPGAEDAATTRAALLLFAEETVPPAAVVLGRDLDGRDERARGFAQAAGAHRWPFVVIPALAQPELEAWEIAACKPEGEDEQAAHAQVRQALGFDPVAYPGRLSSRNQTDRRDAKRVLAELTSAGRSAEERWRRAPLADLHHRGADCGLQDFLEGVERDLLPLFGADRPVPPP